MLDLKKQRVAEKCCFPLLKTAAETLAMLETAYKEDVIKKLQVYEWLSPFKAGELLIDDNLVPGDPQPPQLQKKSKRSGIFTSSLFLLVNLLMRCFTWEICDACATH